MALSVQAELAAGIDEAVGDERLEDVYPTGAPLVRLRKSVVLRCKVKCRSRSQEIEELPLFSHVQFEIFRKILCQLRKAV